MNQFIVIATKIYKTDQLKKKKKDLNSNQEVDVSRKKKREINHFSFQKNNKAKPLPGKEVNLSRVQIAYRSWGKVERWQWCQTFQLLCRDPLCENTYSTIYDFSSYRLLIYNQISIFCDYLINDCLSCRMWVPWVERLCLSSSTPHTQRLSQGLGHRRDSKLFVEHVAGRSSAIFI